MTENKCPCCGRQTKKSSPVRVSFEENTLWYNGQEVRLTRRLLRLADILAKRFNVTVPQGLIVETMWGDAEGDYAETNVKVGVTQLRKVLAPLGLYVFNTWAVGYRLGVMENLSRTETKPAARAADWRNHRKDSAVWTREDIDASA